MIMCKPLVTAHTGCENTPDNTVASIMRGITSGADIVEIDVRSTADGHPILMHDECLQIGSHGAVPVSQISLADLLTLEERGKITFSRPSMEITVFEDALDLAKESGIILNIDLKDSATVNALIRRIITRNMEDYTVISGCNRERATLVKQEYPAVQVLLNVEDNPEDAPDYQSFVQHACNSARQAGCCGINIDFHHCQSQLVEYARLRYLPVSVWTVDREQDMSAMIDLGVHSITTYEPGKLLKLMSANGSQR